MHTIMRAVRDDNVLQPFEFDINTFTRSRLFLEKKHLRNYVHTVKVCLGRIRITRPSQASCRAANGSIIRIEKL